jgi:hypothetical protein
MGLGADAPPVPDLDQVRVYVQNNSGADREAFDVLALTGVLNSIEDADGGSYAWARQPTFAGQTPSSESVAFGVLDQAAPYVAGGQSPLATAVVAGTVPVDVDITNAGHGFATPTPSNPTKLTSAAAGPARILYKPSGTGVKRCVVHLLGATPAPVSGGSGTGVGTPVALNTWEATSIQVTLPASATYLLVCTVSGEIAVTGGTGNVHTRLYNVGAVAAIPYTESVLFSSSGGGEFTTAMVAIHQAVAGDVIRVDTYRTLPGGGSFTLCQIRSAVPSSNLCYVRLN